MTGVLIGITGGLVILVLVFVSGNDSARNPDEEDDGIGDWFV